MPVSGLAINADTVAELVAEMALPLIGPAECPDYLQRIELAAALAEGLEPCCRPCSGTVLAQNWPGGTPSALNMAENAGWLA